MDSAIPAMGAPVIGEKSPLPGSPALSRSRPRSFSVLNCYKQGFGLVCKMPSLIIPLGIVYGLFNLLEFVPIVGNLLDVLLITVYAAAFRPVLNAVRGRPASMRDLWGFTAQTGGELRYLGFIEFVAFSLGDFLLGLPTLALIMLWRFAPIVVVDAQVPWQEGLSRSWRMVMSNPLGVLGFHLLSIVLIILGCSFCCVGEFLSYSVIFAAEAFIYESLRSDLAME